MHPFDTGDIVVIRDVNYRVLEMSLYYTIFERLDGQQTYIANAILAKEVLRNFRRSENQAEGIEIQIDYMTHPDKIMHLEERMNEYYRSKTNMYRNPITISYKEVLESNRLTIVVPVLFKKNWQDWKARSIARNDMMKLLQKQIYELKIEYKPLKQTIKMLKEQ
eukprot:NODE_109_length_18665_cov_0.924486.p17 type:complete len:164 gc:universal NODE_109_length_18665_cov_0.924486:12477-12968(+)